MSKSDKEKLMKQLFKRAEGYAVEEKVTEYVIDEDGNKRAVKEKTQHKYIPPDITAAKTYLELSEENGEFDGMSDEELEAEKARLIKALQ